MSKRITLFVCLCLSQIFAVSAKVVAVVSSVSGNAFYMSAGKTSLLKAGDHLPSQSEVFTEVGAQVTLNDYYDHIFHLSGSGHITIHQNLIELKTGYLWAQAKSYNAKYGPMRVVTANSSVEFKEGEGVISFDNMSSKTQLLTIKGTFLLKNTLQEFIETDVEEGKFSFIATNFNDGRPRTPTAVGYKSYKKITGLFSGVVPLEKVSHIAYESKVAPKKSDQARSIASTSSPSAFEMALSTKKMAPKDNEIIYLKTISKEKVAAQKASREKLLSNYQESSLSKPILVKKKKTKKWKPSYKAKSQVVVRIFGQVSKKGRGIASVPTSDLSEKKSLKLTVPVRIPIKQKEAHLTKTSRMPASTIKTRPSSGFESKLTNEYKKQMRHKKELNSLIDELKSVDNDYKKNY